MTASGTVFDRTAIIDFAQSDGCNGIDDYVIHKGNENCIARLHTARGKDATYGPWKNLRYFFIKKSDAFKLICDFKYFLNIIIYLNLLFYPNLKLRFVLL